MQVNATYQCKQIKFTKYLSILKKISFQRINFYRKSISLLVVSMLGA